MVAGGTLRATITPLGVGGFASARALVDPQRRPHRPHHRPWDRDRDGFVLGEGAGVLVLEEYEHAKKRGAKIYAELVGFGMTGGRPPHHGMPNVDPAPSRSMKAALRNAQCQPVGCAIPERPRHVSTPPGDINETRAIKQVVW